MLHVETKVLQVPDKVIKPGGILALLCVHSLNCPWVSYGACQIQDYLSPPKCYFLSCYSVHLAFSFPGQERTLYIYRTV